MEDKATFKFNGGLGALLCSQCSTIIKIGTEFTEEESSAMKSEVELGPQYCEECSSGVPTQYYKLVREDDGKTCFGHTVRWFVWNEDKTFKGELDYPQVGASCIIDPDKGSYFTWMTTRIESFTIEGNITTFRTRNSNYTLTKLESVLTRK